MIRVSLGALKLLTKNCRFGMCFNASSQVKPEEKGYRMP
jgi:hypothetical protein